MAYVMNEETLSLKKMIEDFMVKEVLPIQKEVDASGEFPIEMYKKAFNLGLSTLNIPEAYGGGGLDHQSFGMLLETIGSYEPGFAITMLVNALVLECALHGKNEEQIAHVSDIILNGGMGAFCLTEANSGSDSVSLRTTYVKDGDDYVINGTKCFVTNGGYADVYIIFATKDRALGAKGVSCFIVDRETPGLAVGAHENKMGLRFSNTVDLALTDVRIPASRLLGEEGKGMHIALGSLDMGRLHNASISTGLCQGALDAAVKYAGERQTFGVPIIKHQMIQAMLADMAMTTETARQLVRYGMYLADEGQPITKIASMSKCYCGDAAMKVTTDAVQVLGGYGYSREYPVEKMMRDAKIFQIFEGAQQIQRMVIARQLAMGN